MADDLETQVEEEEALLAIYDGDPAFKRISATVYQYMVSWETRYEFHQFMYFLTADPTALSLIIQNGDTQIIFVSSYG